MSAYRNAVASQLTFVLSFGICIAILPRSLFVNQGLSYFGNFANTIIPYYIGLLGSAFFVFRVAQSLPKKSISLTIRYFLITFVVCIIGLALTPSMYSLAVGNAHKFFGALLFILQIILSMWFTFSLRPNATNYLLMIIMFGAGIASATYVLPPHGWSLESQAIIQLAFGILLIRLVRFIETYISKE